MRNIPALVAARATTSGGAWAFHAVRADGGADSLTYGQLRVRSAGVAAMLRGRGVRPGDRVLVSAPAGLDYAVAFLGAVHAGAIAVPAYPPRGSRHDERLAAIVADSSPVLALGTADARDRAGRTGLLDLPWAVVADADPDGDLDAEPGEVAFLQYTSGSTAAPKGVVVTQRAVCANLAMIADNFALTSRDSAVSWLPPYHDMGLVGGLLAPIWGGIPCTLLTPAAFAQDPAAWLRTISQRRATISGGPDFAYRQCLERLTDADLDGVDLSSWRLAFTGAEPVRARTIERFAARFARYGFAASAVHPCYGLAEATLIVAGARAGAPPVVRAVDPVALAGHRIVPDDGGTALVSSGRPLCPVRIDAPDGGVGEIVAGGDGIAAGFWGRPAESAAAFRDGGLRTGDLGFLLDGELFVTGRRTDVVIVRGRNLYPQDIEEQVVGAHPALVGQTAVAFTAGDGLGVAVEMDRHSAGDVVRDALGAARRAVVQGSGVDPVVLVAVARASLPRTSSGKVQRALTGRRHADGLLIPLAADREPDGERELGRDPESAGNLEFAGNSEFAGNPESAGNPGAGGDRRSAGDVGGALRTALDAVRPGISPDVPLTQAGLDSLGAAHFVAEAARRGCAVDLEQVLTGATLRELDLDVRPAAASAEPGHDPRRAFWLHEQVSPGSPAHAMAGAWRLRDDVDRDRLDAALRHLLDRHPVLRTRIGADGVPVLDPPPERLLRRADPIDRAGLDAALTALCSPAPRLTDGGLVRATLVPVPGFGPVLHVLAHHAVVDLRSAEILLDELDRAYHGRTLPPPPDPDPRVPTDPAHLDWWRARRSPDRAEFPADRHAPPTHRGRTLRRPLRTDVGDLARAGATTVFAVRVAAVAILVARHAGAEEVVLGIPAAAPGDAIGPRLALLPVRIDLADADSVTDAVRVTRDALAAALARSSVAVDELAALAGGRGRHPLFDIAVVDHTPRRPVPGSLVEAAIPVDRGGAAFDLSLIFEPGGVAVEYAEDRFTAPTAAALAERLDALLAAMAADPSAGWTRVPFAAVPEAGSGVDVGPLPGGGRLHEAVWEQAARTPNAVAVHDGTTGWTYAQLRQRARRAAGGLVAAGVRPGDLVALAMPRSAELIAAMLAVLSAGAAYLPMDPAHPAERILADARPALVLTGLDGLGEPDGADIDGPVAPRAVDPADVAYVIYTSGSTGAPKGVVVEHRHVTHSTAARRVFGDDPGVFALFSSPAFDSSVAGIFWTLTTGGTLLVAAPGTERDPAAAWDLLDTGTATHTLMLPGLWSAVLDVAAGRPRARLRWVAVAGEECPPALADRHAEVLPDVALVNEYGPTEATVWATAHVVEPGDVVPIGRPAPGMRAHVVDRWGADAPAGVVGELYLAGPQVARGYRDGTAGGFLDDPLRGRVYRTGDRVSRRADGALRFHGRVDDQIKIRGYRVEPAEVEAVLAGHPAVAGCAVVARRRPSGPVLLAYAVLRAPGADLRAWLAERLPPAWVPDAVIALDALPRTPHGKVDRAALPSPVPVAAAGRAPAGRWEEAVARAYREVLGAEPVGADDDFFDLGGNSLAAAQVTGRLAVEGITVGVRDVFEEPTVARLARRIAGRAPVVPATPIARQPRRAGVGR